MKPTPSQSPARPGRGRPPAGAIPAVVVLAACGVLTVAVFLKPARPDVATLRARAERAMAAGDANTAVLTYQHLMALEPDRSMYKIDLAKALSQFGRRGEAFAILTTIAPEAGGGDPAAHLLLAEWLIEARVLGGSNDAALPGRAIRHLDAAMADDKLRRAATDLRGIAESMRVPATTPATK